jgi:hypothetical protein
MRRTLLLFVPGFLTLLASGPAFAQGAGFSGEVIDPQKAVVPNAAVRVVNQQTTVERRTKTNGAGFYMVPYLVPGTYKIFVQAQGFETAVSEELTVTVGQMRVVRFRLRLGASADYVIVSGASQTFNTTDASVSTIVDRQFVGDLPLNGRSFQALIFLAPGVQINVTNSGDQGQFAVNGQRANANYFTIDGVSANVGSWYFPGQYAQASAGTLPATNIQGGFNGLVSIDDLQEFQVLTSTFSPEFGRTPGAQVIVVTRSGTDQYHGAIYEYFRNEVLDANDWFANELGLPRPPLRLNDYGGVLGGPVRFPGYDGHDKTFFFFSYENQGFELPQVLQSVVPTLASRQSATPDAAQILNAFPKPNGADLGLDGAEFNASYGAKTHSYAISFRADHRFNDRYSVFGRFDYSPSTSSSLSFQNLAERDFTGSNVQTYTVGATQVINSRWVNEIRGNYTRTVGSATSTMTRFADAVPPSNSVLWPGGNIPAYGISSFGIDNLGGSPFAGFQAGRQNANIPHQYNVLDNLSYLREKHQFRFGADYRLVRTNISASNLGSLVAFANPTPDTSGIVTLNSGIASFAAIFNQAGEVIDYKAFSLYAQDTWQVSPRLTITYGTRWEINPSPKTVAGQKPYTACCATDLSNLSLSAAGAPYYPTRYQDFAPRLGAAYQIVQTPGRSLVLRTGGGIFYDLGQSGPFGNNNWPYSNFVFAEETPYPVPPGYLTFPPVNPVPSPDNPAIVSVAGTNFRLPRTYEWNVTLEQSLGASQNLSAAYVGARGHDLLRNETYLDPNPDFSEVLLVTNNGFSSYNSLQVQFTSRLTHGFQSYASYTYSHSIDNASTDSATVIPAQFVNTYNDKGNSTFDARHTFNGAVVYTVPTPKMDKVPIAFLDNWSIQGIFTARTSLPFDVLVQDPQFITDPRFPATPRANVVPGQPLFLYGSSFPGGKEANPDAFAGLEPGQLQGDLGRNTLQGFGLVQFDFSMSRRFNIKEKAAIEFRVEVFNIFNHPNFANPGGGAATNSLGAPNFGQSATMFGTSLGGGSNQGGVNPIFAIGGPRNLQLALRFEF